MAGEQASGSLVCAEPIEIEKKKLHSSVLEVLLGWRENPEKISDSDFYLMQINSSRGFSITNSL